MYNFVLNIFFIKKFVEHFNDDQIQRTREIFNICDQDNDGVITKIELLKLVKELGY